MQFSADILKTFIEISEQGSFSLAAERLNKSQPGVSTLIAALEKQAALKLFDRSERPLRLTEAGVIFLEFAREVINRSIEVDRSLRELAMGTAGEVKIGASTSVGAYLLARLASDIQHKHPQLMVSLLTQPRDRIYDAVRDAEVSCAFVLSDSAPSDLSVTPLRDEPLYFVASPNYALAQRHQIAAEHVRQSRFIMGPKTSGYTSMVNGILERNRISNYSVAMRISNFEGIKEAVRAGAGICLLPHCAIKRELLDKSLVRVRVKQLHLSAKIFLIERQRPSTSPALEAVKKFLIAGISMT